jgi:hypothetical protein
MKSADFCVAESEAQIQAGLCGGLQLREDMLAIKGHEGRAGTSFDISAEVERKGQNCFVERKQCGFGALNISATMARGS